MKNKIAWTILIILIVFVNIGLWKVARETFISDDTHELARFSLAFVWGCFCALGGTVIGVKLLGDKEGKN